LKEQTLKIFAQIGMKLLMEVLRESCDWENQQWKAHCEPTDTKHKKREKKAMLGIGAIAMEFYYCHLMLLALFSCVKIEAKLFEEFVT